MVLCVLVIGIIIFILFYNFSLFSSFFLDPSQQSPEIHKYLGVDSAETDITVEIHAYNTLTSVLGDLIAKQSGKTWVS